jgi:hypothetical protein
MCQQEGLCPFPEHTLASSSDVTSSKCGYRYSYRVDVAESHVLKNALEWANKDGANPYIAFESAPGVVSIDPTGVIGPLTPGGGSEICQKTSLTDISGTPCTCAYYGIYSNGYLRNDRALTPRTYYCRQE